ncbi:hypothetical protein SBA3_910042 [Candidatus Sulfopaludibacter sp. SbA3]|nr:hypothetical protein SBA3_910042 [Candidatus Sulfopaludibacter sp. SbA3]
MGPRLNTTVWPALFADCKVTAGKAASELGWERLAFVELLRHRGIPTSSTLRKTGKRTLTNAIDEFEGRRKTG